MANDDVMWATVGFSILSLLMICIMIGLSCYNEFTKPDLTICGSIGIYICCGLACKYSCLIIHSLRSFCRYRSTDYVSLRKTKEIKDRKQNNSK